MSKLSEGFETAKNTIKAAATVSGFLPEGSYTSAKDRFPQIIIGPSEQKNIDYEGPLRNPVILIHGFLGAHLRDTKSNRNVWGKFHAQDVLNMPNERFRSLAIPMEIGKSLNELEDDIVPDGVLDKVKVTFYKYTYEQKGYSNLIDVLEEGGYHFEGSASTTGKTFPTLFSFAYDWRRDIQWNVVRLHKFILEKKAYIAEVYERLYGLKEYNVKFDLMGHSMGGLLTRYYLRFGPNDLPADGAAPKVTWAGAENVANAFLLGTPNAGYADTLLELTRGIDIPPAPPALIGTWPTYYQMLPPPGRRTVISTSNPAKGEIDLFDIDIWKKMRWGLADPRQDAVLKKLLPNVSSAEKRGAIAIDHLEKCLKRAKSFVQAMSVDATPPQGINLFLVLGNAIKTSNTLAVNEQNGSLKVLEYAPGDGKVTKASALFDQRNENNWTPHFRSPIKWKNIILLRAAHMGITVDQAFKDNVLFLLTNRPS